MKILITGSNGLTGHKIVFQAIKQDFDVLATSYSYNNFPEDNNYKFELLDITNKAEVDYIIGSYNPDIIINTAGITKPDDCEKDNILCRNVNVIGVKNLIDISNKLDCKLVHFSTDFVFSGDKGMYSETDIPNPLNYYAQTKLESEQLVANTCNKYVIIRTVLVYGYSKYLQKSNILLWVLNNLEQNKPIKVVNDQYRTPTLVDDLAKATIDIINNNLEGIYHISGNEYLSVYEFALKIAEVFELNAKLISPISTIQLNETAKRPAKTGFNTTKAFLDFNYTPTSLYEGLQQISLHYL
jgi:dTDP-4-dehydrorhamnose reductase